jgi:hypothetical protein
MGRSKAKTIPVSKRALVQRINRVIAKEGDQLRATRGRQRPTYYIVDVAEDARPVNLEELGRKLGVLQPYERLEEDPDA